MIEAGLLGIVCLLLGYLMGAHAEAWMNFQPYLVVLLLALIAYAVELLHEGGRPAFQLGGSLLRFLTGLVLAELVVWLGVRFQLDLYLAPVLAYVMLAFLYLHGLNLGIDNADDTSGDHDINGQR